MDQYPEDYVVHNLPLIVCSGLDQDEAEAPVSDGGDQLLQEGGFRLKIDAPVVSSPLAIALRRVLSEQDAAEEPWSAKYTADATSRGRAPGCRIKHVGRTLTLPARKAPPPPHSPRMRARDNASMPAPMVLHSTISPLTPSSPLYPDGLMTPLWVAKHQSCLPAVFAAFFNLVDHPDTSTLEDNRLKVDINHIKSVIASTNYKTKIAIVLLGDELDDHSDVDRPDVKERMDSLRKATNLDAKSLWYLPSDASSAQVIEFVVSLLTSFHPLAMEYYRDLSKHARRKRNRTTAPLPTVAPSSGTSQTLTLAAWSVRYEFKLGIFAEFRQETEAAVRNYETAYEALFGPEIFQAIPSWSPRFNQARMFSDVIAIRIIRGLLWTGQTTAAVQRWIGHRNQIASVLERSGPGTATYGWEAWQSTWSEVMVDLVRRAKIFLTPAGSEESLASRLPMIRATRSSLPDERSSPWESLHHEGYWLERSQSHTQERRARAKQMPEEDRKPPGQSPASAIASKAQLYDTYLTLEPHAERPLHDALGFDYSQRVLTMLRAAIQQFIVHGQPRHANLLRLKLVTELVEASSWTDAVTVLLPVWQDPSLRQSGWWDLLRQIGLVLLSCATEAQDAGAVAALKWECAHPWLSQSSDPKDGQEPDAASPDPGAIQVDLSAYHVLTCVSASFAFASAKGYAGKPVDVQLCIRRPHAESHFQIRHVKVAFTGALTSILLSHDDHSASDVDGPQAHLINVDLAEQPLTTTTNKELSDGSVVESILGATANLASKQGQIQVFSMQLVPYVAGEVAVKCVEIAVEAHGSQLALSLPQYDDDLGEWWETRNGHPVARACGSSRNVRAISILPKPPKLDISIPQMGTTFYTDETISLSVMISNLEDEATVGTIVTRLISPPDRSIRIQWDDMEDTAAATTTTGEKAHIQTLPGRDLKQLSPNAHSSFALLLTQIHDAVDHELEITVSYTVASHPESLLSKLLTIDVPVIRPFEANYRLEYQLYDEPWPNFFSDQSISHDPSVPVGLKSHFGVVASVISFASEDIEVVTAQLQVKKLVGNIVCKVEPRGNEAANDSDSRTVMKAEQTDRFTFDMLIQKQALGDLTPAHVDTFLEIRWKRLTSDTVNTTRLESKQFKTGGTEPRLLVRLAKDSTLPSVYLLTYTVENPSLHFLTFIVTMESSEAFAFSGPKSKNLSLVPISRQHVSYRIMPLHPGANSTTTGGGGGSGGAASSWMAVNLNVTDAYFGHTLRALPASDGIRVDKNGKVIIRVER